MAANPIDYTGPTMAASTPALDFDSPWPHTTDPVLKKKAVAAREIFREVGAALIDPARPMPKLSWEAKPVPEPEACEKPPGPVLVTRKKPPARETPPEPVLVDAEPRLLYDRKGAARQLSISVRALGYVIAAKGLDTRRVGGKIMVPRASLIQYAKGNHLALTNRSDADAVDSGDK